MENDRFTVKFFLFLMFQVFAFWPVWRWYVVRLADPSDEPWGVIALGTALVMILVNRRHDPSPRFKPLIPTFLLILYSVTFHVFPPLLRAVIAVTTLACTLNIYYLGGGIQLWLYGLLCLSLPVIPTMQFYLGYPLRIITGKLSVFLFNLSGFPVRLEGIAFSWNGELIWIDALCSGIRKMWAGMFLTFALAAFYKFGAKKTIILTGISMFALLFANTLRSTALFYLEVGIVTGPWWVHKGTGLVTFLCAAIAIAWCAQKIQRGVICGDSKSTS